MSLFNNDKLIRNKYIIYNDIVFIWMNNINQYTMIDYEDLKFIAGYHIWCNNTGYATFDYIDDAGRKRHQLLSRYIMQCNNNYNIDNMIVDHINHNTLDNRKCNLRLCTKSENNFNARMAKNNTSGVKGVYKGKTEGKWRAYIYVNNKLYCLGTYNSYDEAVIARKNAEEIYFGQYNYNIDKDVLITDKLYDNKIIKPFKFIL